MALLLRAGQANRVRVKWEDLIQAFEFADCGEPGMSSAYLERCSGKFFYSSYYADAAEEDASRIDARDADPERFIALPDKHDLDLGKSLALDFAATHLPGQYNEIKRIFRRRGAYSRFKAVLRDCGAMEKWYTFETEAVQESLRDWAAQNDIEIIE